MTGKWTGSVGLMSGTRSVKNCGVVGGALHDAGVVVSDTS